MKISLILSLLCALSLSANAGPLNEAKVTKIINDVRVIDPSKGAHPASLLEVIKDELGLRTGIKSRSELKFPDDTLTRIGPETYFSFKSGTREMTLERGTMLLQVPKGLGGAKIHTAAITASITGTTIMLEYIPAKSLKVLVLEGSLRLSTSGVFGDSLLLTPGKMVIMPPNAKRIPDPVTIDIKKVVATSSLVNMSKGKNAGKPALPSMPLIEKEIVQQAQGKTNANLITTNLVIDGHGTNVILEPDSAMGTLDQRKNADPLLLASLDPKPSPSPSPSPTAVPNATPLPTPDSSPTPNPNPPPSGTPTPPPPVGYVTDGTTVIATRSAGPTITTQGVTDTGVIYTNLATNGSPSGFLFGATSAFDNALNFDNAYLQNFAPSAVFVFSSLELGGGLTFHTENGPHSVALVGYGGITNTLGTTIELGSIDKLLFATRAGNITLDSGISFMSSTEKPDFMEFYARGGDVNIGSSFNLSHSTIEFAAEFNALFNSAAAITAKNLAITGLQTVQFDGNANVQSLFQLNGGDVEMGGSVTANNGFIYGTSATINGAYHGHSFAASVTGDFVSSGASALTLTSDSSISAGGNITLGGTFSGHDIHVDSTGGAITIDGTFSGHDIHVNATGGAITLDGAFNGHNVELSSTDNIALNGGLTSDQLTITGRSVSFGTDLTMVTSGGNDITATHGNIDATGHQLTGFDQVSLTNGSFIAGGLSANTLILHQSGGVNVTNDLNLRNPFTGPGSVTVGGLFTAPTITAGNITANALHTNTVTSSGTFTLGSSDLAPFSNNTVTIAAPTVSLPAGANMDGRDGTPTTGPGNASNLTMNTGAFTLGAGLSLNGGDGNPARNDAGGNGGVLNITSNNSITVNAPISATTGQNSHNGTNGGNGGTVNLTATNTVTLNKRIEVSSNTGRRRSNHGGTINVTSNKTSGTAIAVSSSAQLLALLNASATGGGGSIRFVSAGGDINVNGATIQADRGAIDLHNNGNTGVVTIDNATLHADTVRVGALGNNGTLNVGGGTISADSLIHLYAGGSNGTVNFTNNVTLSGNSVKTIAGDTVTIFNGKLVTIHGLAPANVFTNHPNYAGFGGNGTTTGTFGGLGAVTQPLSGAPGY